MTVKETVKRIYWTLGEQSIFVSWLANMLSYVGTGIAWLPWRYRESANHYPNFVGAITPTAPAADDRATNFFIRAQLLGNYGFIIELGALNLGRSIALSTHFKDTHVYALDIGPDYATRRNLSKNLTIGPNNQQMIAEIVASNEGRRGLLCCSGTLTYYKPAGEGGQDIDIGGLISLARRLGLELAIDEPNSSITEQSRQVSLRRTAITWYHPYIHLLLSAGYKLDRGGQQQDHTWGRHIEQRTSLHARLQS